MSSNSGVKREGDKEKPAEVNYQLKVFKTRSELVITAQWNKPDSYEIYGKIGHNRGLPVRFPERVRNGVEQTLNLLKNPTIVQPNFGTTPFIIPQNFANMPVIVPPVLQNPPMVQLVPPQLSHYPPPPPSFQ